MCICTYLWLEAVPADAGGSVDAGGVVGAVEVRGADGADVGWLAGEAAVPVVANRAVATVSGTLGGLGIKMMLGPF